jgi:hypothetical protein
MSPKRWKSAGRFASGPFVHGSAIAATVQAIMQIVVIVFIFVFPF